MSRSRYLYTDESSPALGSLLMPRPIDEGPAKKDDVFDPDERRTDWSSDDGSGGSEGSSPGGIFGGGSNDDPNDGSSGGSSGGGGNKDCGALQRALGQCKDEDSGSGNNGDSGGATDNGNDGDSGGGIFGGGGSGKKDSDGNKNGSGNGGNKNGGAVTGIFGGGNNGSNTGQKIQETISREAADLGIENFVNQNKIPLAAGTGILLLIALLK